MKPLADICGRWLALVITSNEQECLDEKVAFALYPGRVGFVDLVLFRE